MPRSLVTEHKILWYILPAYLQVVTTEESRVSEHQARDDARACRIVYCGPSECGKTTNLEALARLLPDRARGKLVRLATETNRTLYFDLLAIDLGAFGGGIGRARFEIYSVPGQSFYLAARRRVLREADGIVFVVDSRRERLQANLEALGEVVAALEDAGRDLAEVPAVLQLNKRDAPTALGTSELLGILGCDGEPYVEAIAHEGEGVLETLKLIARQALAGRLLSATPV
jgi:signal recognition particle receptor subunit beta